MPDYRCPTCGHLAHNDTLGGRAIGRHYDAEHNPLTAQQRTPDGWETAAEQLIRAAAATGRPFTVAEVLEPIGEHPDPNARQRINGRITGRIAAQGVIEHVDAQKSTKPGTRRSLVYVWRGTAQTTGRSAA